jgi:hypothetical protein
LGFGGAVQQDAADELSDRRRLPISTRISMRLLSMSATWSMLRK